MNLTIKNQPVAAAIFVFCAAYAFFFYTKPAFLYLPDGSLKQFGVGYSRKTILPMWLLSILLSILSYLWVHYYAMYGRQLMT